MRTGSTPRLRLLVSLVHLALIAMLPGCACDTKPDLFYAHGNTGRVETANDESVDLTRGAQRIRLGPGVLTITLLDEKCRRALLIASGKDKMVIELGAGALTSHELRIVGATYGLSADIFGTWYDTITGAPHTGSRKEFCSGPGYCAMPVTKTICDGGNCRQITTTEYGYHSNCSGNRTVTTEYNDFKRHFKIRFVSPQHGNQVLATFTSTTAPFAQTFSASSGGCGTSQ